VIHQPPDLDAGAVFIFFKLGSSTLSGSKVKLFYCGQLFFFSSFPFPFLILRVGGSWQDIGGTMYYKVATPSIDLTTTAVRKVSMISQISTPPSKRSIIQLRGQRRSRGVIPTSVSNNFNFIIPPIYWSTHSTQVPDSHCFLCSPS